MSHGTSDVTLMEYPAKSLGKGIGGVDDARYVFQDDVTALFPGLDGEVLDVDVPGAGSRLGGVDHEDRRLVVFVENGGADLGEPELVEDRAEVNRSLGSGDGGNEFGFGGAGGDGGLKFGPVGNGATTEGKNSASDRATGDRVGSMGSVDVAGELERIGRTRKGGEVGVGVAVRNIGANGEIEQRFGAPVHKAPVAGTAEVAAQTAESGVVDVGGGVRVARELSDRIADIEAADDISVDQFTEDVAVAEAVLRSQAVSVG